jgi:hypothetical protein
LHLRIRFIFPSAEFLAPDVLAMIRIRSLVIATVLVFACASMSSARAQCQDWAPGFDAPHDGADDVIYASATFDDGGGTALFVGGTFANAGGVAAGRVARWNGAHWSPLASGMSGTGLVSVNALAVFDDGSGAALYAAGWFTTAGGSPASNIAKWNGTTWSALGAGIDGTVRALQVFDDGSGSTLYAGGHFTIAGGSPARNVARWNGSSWSPLATGLAGAGDTVLSFASFDEGSGAKLFAGGSFNGGNIARWDGSSWNTLGGGLTSAAPNPSSVSALATFDAGQGTQLFAGGHFTMAGSVSVINVAAWDGTTWSATNGGPDSQGSATAGVRALRAFDDGSGPALFMAGSFADASSVSHVNHVVKWDGSTWSSLAGGMNASGSVYSLSIFDDGGGDALHAGGSFSIAGVMPVSNVAKWNGASWSKLGASSANGVQGGYVLALAAIDELSGPALYAGGSFTAAGSVAAQGVAKWDASGWSPLGAGLAGTVYALAPFDDGSGARMVAGGLLPNGNVAQWTSSAWMPLDAGVIGQVRALAVFDDGNGAALYAGGQFAIAGSVAASNVARWDGFAWTALGVGVGGTVRALCVWNDGGGEALYAAGDFTTAGGSTANHIAKWDGTSWSPLDLGLGPSFALVQALTVFDDGNGPALYAGGDFTSAGSTPAAWIARWNGVNWSAVGTLQGSGGVTSLGVFDDGTGHALYACGWLTPNVQHGVIARWNGTTWTEFGGVLGTGIAQALAVFDDNVSGGADLYVGGKFDSAGGVAASAIAEWRGCASGVHTLCSGDGSFAATCPCANSGVSGHGCENSASTGGALLGASGSTQPDAIVLHASGELSSVLSMFLQGDAYIANGVVFGDGLRCVGGHLKRLYTKTAVGGSVSAPRPGDPSITARSASLGDAIAPGSARYYQTYYRDPSSTFCPAPAGDTWNVTNAVKIVW